MKKCKQCTRSSSDGAIFGTLTKSGAEDVLCSKCRFDAIDAKYSDPEDIRRDMKRSGIPVNRRAEKLK